MAASNFSVLLDFMLYLMGTDGLLTEQELTGSPGLDLWVALMEKTLDKAQ